MNPTYLLLLVISLVLSSIAHGQADEELLAKRGKGIVSQDSFTARANRVPENIRPNTFRDRNRLNEVISTLLLRSQLAADAREAGFGSDAIIKERMRLAAEAELGEAWVQHYVEMQPAADYEALASEYYQLNQDKLLTPQKIDVSHILISAKKHEEEEALEIANNVRQELIKDPASFDQLVAQFSEDPSASSNHGKFTGINRGDMVKQFEDVAFALKDGEISEPVRTKYGFHIIRLDRHIPRTKRSFDEVKEQLMNTARQRHEDRIKQDYLGGLSSINVEITEEALKELVFRLFGEEALNASRAETQSE